MRYSYLNERDIIEDADNWMGEVDRKFLGVKSKKKAVKVEPTNLKE